MYLYLVLFFLIFITVFHAYSKEGMENPEAPAEAPTEAPPIIDTPMANFTETETRIPNRVRGMVGPDLTFEGNLNTEGGNGLELGKNIKKGDNAGKFRYNEETGEVQLFGAGQEGAPHKIRLNDTVEVGDLLQANRANVRGQLGFGANQEGSMYFDDQGKQLTIRGSGPEGERKVKIWDEAEVGKLLATRGVDVKGDLNAYNDMNVYGSLQSKGKMFAQDVSVIGNLDINGTLSNPRLDFINTSLNQLNQRIDDFDRPSIGRSIEETKKQANEYTDSMINNAYSTLRGEANAANSAMLTNTNASFQAFYQDQTNMYNMLNTSIMQSNERHDGAYAKLDQALKVAVADIKKENASTIATNFNNLVEQINNASRNASMSMGTVNTMIAAANSSIGFLRADLDVTNVGLSNLSTNIRKQYLLDINDINTSLEDIYKKSKTQMTKNEEYDTVLQEWNASKGFFQDNAKSWNTNHNLMVKTASEWVKSRDTLKAAAEGWNLSSAFFNNAATSWMNSSKELIDTATDWKNNKGLLNNNSFNTLTVGSGDREWSLTPYPDRLAINKTINSTANKTTNSTAFTSTASAQAETDRLRAQAEAQARAQAEAQARAQAEAQAKAQIDTPEKALVRSRLNDAERELAAYDRPDSQFNIAKRLAKEKKDIFDPKSSAFEAANNAYKWDRDNITKKLEKERTEREVLLVKPAMLETEKAFKLLESEYAIVKKKRDDLQKNFDLLKS